MNGWLLTNHNQSSNELGNKGVILEPCKVGVDDALIEWEQHWKTITLRLIFGEKFSKMVTLMKNCCRCLLCRIWVKHLLRKKKWHLMEEMKGNDFFFIYFNQLPEQHRPSWTLTNSGHAFFECCRNSFFHSVLPEFVHEQ